MRWTAHLEGGPRRVNHAAVAINGRIYSFGGYSSEEKYARHKLIDVHVLDTVTLRWQKITTANSRKCEKRKSPELAASRLASRQQQNNRSQNNNADNNNSHRDSIVVPHIIINDAKSDTPRAPNFVCSATSTSSSDASATFVRPTTSASFCVDSPSLADAATHSSLRQTPLTRRSIPFAFSLAGPIVQDHMGRRRSVAELHPLGQLRSYRPPCEDDAVTNDDAILSLAGEGSSSHNSAAVVVDASAEDEHEFSLIHRFRRQRSATMDATPPAPRIPDFDPVNVTLRQQLSTFAGNVHRIQEEAIAFIPPHVNQMAQDFDELGAMEIDDYYYGEAPQPAGEANNAGGVDDISDGEIRDEDDEYLDSDGAYESNESEDDLEDFGDEDEENEREEMMNDGEQGDYLNDRPMNVAEEDAENRLYPAAAAYDDGQNFIDGNEDDEVYDDFDFNYHNLANVGVAARLRRLQRVDQEATRRRLASQQNAAGVMPVIAAGVMPVIAVVAPPTVERRVLELLQAPRNAALNAAFGDGVNQRRRAQSLFVRGNAPRPAAAVAPPTRRKSRQYVAPFQRYGHTVVAYNGKAYLWGGRSDEHSASTVLHEFDSVSLRWSVVRPAAGSFEPPARDGHTAVVHNDTMYVFGGFEERFHRFSQETYAFHFPTSTWSLLRTEGTPPLHRDFHTACVLGHGKMYIFGGRSDESGQFISDNDVYCSRLYCLDLNTLHWSEVQTTGQAPSGRRSHSVWTHNDKMYVFGGYSGSLAIHFDDMYVFDPRLNHWNVVRPTCGVDCAPVARRRQCTVAVGDRVFLFGGTMPSDSKRRLMDLADLYVLDYSPSLTTLCAEALVRYGLDMEYKKFLPETLRKDVENMHTPNTITLLIFRNDTLLSI